MQYPGDIRKLQRISLLILLFCIAGMAVGADAATPVRGAVTTTSPFSNPNALTTATVPPVCQAPCECLSTADAQARWGAGGYTQCSQTPCSRYSSEFGTISYYCYQQKKVTTAAIRDIPPVTTTVAPVRKAVADVPTTIVMAVVPAKVPEEAKEDPDNDHIVGFQDNCRYKYNPNQADDDGDGVGDACDNCWNESNAEQTDSDGDCTSFQNDPHFWGYDPLINAQNNPLYASCGKNLCGNPAYAQRWLQDPKCGDACDQCPGKDDTSDKDRDFVPDCVDKCPGVNDAQISVCNDCGDWDNDGNANCLEQNATLACAVDHGKGKGLPDTEGTTECEQACPKKPQLAEPESELKKLMEKLQKDPDFFDQWVTNPLDAVERNGFQISDSQVSILGSIPDSTLKGGYNALSKESRQQILAKGPNQASAPSSSCGTCTFTPTPDGIPDICDNCPAVYNPKQEDNDHDGFGDLCDNCPDLANDQSDAPDYDNIGTMCDLCPLNACWDANGKPDNGDSDHDGKGNCCDNCRQVPNPSQQDSDQDGVGDACDTCWGKDDLGDSDGDCLPLYLDSSYWDPLTGWKKDPHCNDVCDNCVKDFNPYQEDSDDDDLGDLCTTCPTTNPDKTDTDGDGHRDVCDNCPFAYSLFQTDSDGDGVGNACDCDDRVKNDYEIAMDCGLRQARPNDDPRVKQSIASGKAGCADHPCSPCGIPGNGNFSWTDWRGKNWMSPPSSQGDCGSCWVHSPINVMEAMYNIHSGQSIGGNQWDALGDTVKKNNMNVENNRLAHWVVTNNAPGWGCNGGFNDDAMSWINEHGVPDQANYRHYRLFGYKSVQDDCCGGIDDDASGQEQGDWMMYYLKCRGPLSICTPYWSQKTFDASPFVGVPFAEITYHGGHCFVLVGYNPNSKYGGGAWLIKNNWGDSWPEPGSVMAVDGFPGYAWFSTTPNYPGEKWMKGTFTENPAEFTGAVYEG